MQALRILMLAAAAVVQTPWADVRPGKVEVDRFHPDRATKVEPRRGGSVSVHVQSLPPSLNAMIESSGVARQILYELHDSLLARDWETWEYVPSLAESYEVEDTLVLTDGSRVIGVARERGDKWHVTSSRPPMSELDLDKSRVERIERSTVFTFRLRDGVKWHDGQPFGARDVLFSFQCFKNPGVRCDRKRYLFDKIASAEQLDARVVRFRFEHSYFLAPSAFDESFTILPAHLFDLADPNNPAHKLDATPEEQAKLVNESPHNRQWIGLGPYRLVEWGDGVLTAKRVDGYAGANCWLDTLRWRAIADTQAATTALLNGEIDYFDRLSIADYFGERTQSDAFTSRNYKGFFFAPSVSITAWNTARPALADARVRTALGMCFDGQRFIDGFYRGLAMRVTGEQMPFSSAYDRELAPLPFDPAGAKRLLAQAEWIDRDGDGVLDKDGAKLAIGYLFPAGNEVSSTFGEAFQAELAKIGVQLVLEPRESAALSDALRKREFDSAAIGLALPFASDPEQMWHSKWAASPSANRSGLHDAQVDALIDEIQREVDRSRADELFHRLQRRLFELQPVLFGVCAPRRVAVARRVRGVQFFALDPGYSLRRWWVE